MKKGVSRGTTVTLLEIAGSSPIGEVVVVSSSFQARLDAVDSSILTPLVRQHHARPALEVAEWSYRRITGGAGTVTGAGYGTIRFTGRARDGGELLSWSLILKALRKSERASVDVANWNYWKREILAYQSGVLKDLPGLGAPRCYGVIEHPGNEYWIWLEEVNDDIEGKWSLQHFALAARSLGRFNGAYRTSHATPEMPWLSRGRVHDWLKEGEPVIPELHLRLDHPLAKRWFRGDSVDRILRLWNDRGEWLAVLDGLPRALCQHDAFRRNLLTHFRTDGGVELIGIDWQMLGTGAVGEELAPLVAMSLAFFEFDIDRVVELDEAVVEGYLEGLVGTGWRGDERDVRFGFAASTALLAGLASLRAPFNTSAVGSRPFQNVMPQDAV